MEKSEYNDQLVQHASQLLDSLERLRQDQVLTDISICVGNTQIHCHKLILEICGFDFIKLSELGSRCDKKSGLCPQTVIKLNNAEPAVIQEIIQYCYSGNLILTDENVKQMLELATLMDHEFLANECLKFLDSQIEEFQHHQPQPNSFIVCQPMHGINLLTELQCLRSQRRHTNIKLVCSDEVFACHSLVLAACSDYFRAMFSHDFTEKKAKKIDLLEPADIVEDLLTFMYTSMFDVECEDFLDLLESAAYFQVYFPPVTIESIKTIVQPDNCIKIFNVSNVFSTNLRNYTLRFILNSFPKLTNHEDFLTLSLSMMVQILSDDRLNVMAEESVFLAASRWLAHDMESRAAYVDELMECVRFPLLHEKFLRKIMEKEPSVIKSQKCKEMVVQALCTKDGHASTQQAFSEKFHPRNSMNQDVIFVLAQATDEMSPPQCAFIGLRDLAVHDVCTKHNGLPLGLSRFTIICIDTDIFVIGGWDMTSEVCCSTTWKYSITENLWSTCANLQLPRYDIGVCKMDQVVYAIGGQINSPDVCNPVNLVERYEVETDEWSEVAPLPSSLIKPVVTVFKDRIYAMDSASHSKVIRTLCIYYSYTGMWAIVPAGVGLMNMRYIQNLFTVADYILCWGMYDAADYHQTFNAFQNFNAENFPPRRGGMLVRHPPIVSPRIQYPTKFEPVNLVGLALLNDEILVVSDAQARRGRYLLVHRYDPFENQWVEQLEISSRLSRGITSSLQCVAYRGYIASPWYEQKSTYN
ncbi:ectoderm-neural cortex protein 1-like [Saccoglossus kowalevskii]|uniref:Kelch repeat and BTB domain-containing protein 2-like n=1 Tax=Saccoglossus kowalevskii TaxID=10224 RepID=A0ABM0M8R3_SACKO|nr:PREDICTED: kelch repeat and BTB domain-containing protein 2-like [Saccoglossus kowalevskii]